MRLQPGESSFANLTEPHFKSNTFIHSWNASDTIGILFGISFGITASRQKFCHLVMVFGFCWITLWQVHFEDALGPQKKNLSQNDPKKSKDHHLFTFIFDNCASPACCTATLPFPLGDLWCWPGTLQLAAEPCYCVELKLQKIGSGTAGLSTQQNA